MFKKKPTIKPLAPLRSSDRRKIADQIIRDYNVQVPVSATPESEQHEDDDHQESSAPSLASIRNSLLPENTQAGRFTTTSGPNHEAVHGTIYVGTHPGCEERVLWFRLEQGPDSDGRLYPTVYTLWHNPGLVPLLHTPEFVMGKLFGGADLMTPGLANGPPFPEKATKGSVVAVASLERPSVPLFVGICEIDVSSLEKVQGMKGHAVRGVQWEGDELWSWSADGRPGGQPPEHLDGWLKEPKNIEQAVEELGLEERENVAHEPVEEHEGGVSLVEENEPVPEIEEKEPTTKEIDEAFEKAFIYALYQHKRDNPSQPNHGLSFPIQPSFVVSNLITPYLPIRTPQQAQYYQIKKTSWKNVKKFIKHLDKSKLVKSKDRGGGETIILDVDFEHSSVENFVPHKLPRKSTSEGAGKSGAPGKAPAAAGKDPTVGQAITVKTLYKPSGKLTPDLFPPLSNSDPKNYYSSADIQKRLTDYLSSQDPPIISPSNPRIINLNPFISNKILSSNSPSDQAILASGTILRDALFKRIIEDPTLCAPYHALLKPGQTQEDVKLKPGALPKITVTIERRTGSKVVTRVVGLETFGVLPQVLAEELQKKCASSTSVTQATGAAKGVMEVLVQGDHRRVLEAALNNRGVKSQWIDIVDKTHKKGR
ncbi:hypothetical protein VTO42DRAFT_8080 [Malbranchea cinnamomea]